MPNRQRNILKEEGRERKGEERKKRKEKLDTALVGMNATPLIPRCVLIDLVGKLAGQNT